MKLATAISLLALVAIGFAQNSPAQQPPESSTVAAAADNSSVSPVEPANCATQETNYSPCVAKERADSLFKHCCQQYAPDGCQSLCQYETKEIAAHDLLKQAMESGKCELKHISTILYCASQNQDNRKCCSHLNLSDAKLGVGDSCLRFCDPAGGIAPISHDDVTCLFNWSVLMYCHHAGIKAE